MSVLDARAQRTVLYGMVAVLALGAFAALAVSTAMPTVAAELDGMRLYTYAFSATSVASVVGMLMAGRWADLRGPTSPLWTGLGLFLAGLLVAGLAPNMGVLIAGRVLQGLGGGLQGVAIYVLVARVFSSERHPKVFSAFAAAWVVPGLVGPLLAGTITQYLGWRGVFLLVPVLAVPALLALRPGMVAARGGRTPDSPGSEDAVPSETDEAGAALHARDLVLAVVSGARGLGAAIATRALASAAFMGAEVLLPLVLVRERGIGPAFAGTVLTLGVLGWSAGSWVRGRGFRGLTHVGFLRAGGALLAGGIAGVALVAVPGMPLGVALAPWTLAGLGMGLANPTVSLLVLELAPRGAQGVATSGLQVADALAAALALAGTGTLLWALYDAMGLPAYAVCIALAAALAAGVAILAGRTRPVPVTFRAPAPSGLDEYRSPARSY